MTDEELQRTMQELSESTDELSNRDEPLSKEGKKRKQMLSLQKEILQKIKEARAKNDFSQERDLTITYGLLTSLGEKHPFLIALLQAKFKWTVF